MGKPTGFIEYLRELPLDRSAIARINDWNEFHEHMDDKKLREQAARCMDCGIPFCHTGNLVSGMASGCPINNLIPEWNDLVYRGLWHEALQRLHKTNNFPDDHQQNPFGTIKKNGEYLLNLVNELLDFRKLEQQKIKLKVVKGDWIAFSQEIYLSFKESSLARSFRRHWVIGKSHGI